jgi:putative flippase GtrA
MTARIPRFASVGLMVTVLGFAVLALLVEGLGWSAHIAYAVQAAVSIEASFVLNRGLTWRDRRGDPVWRQWLRFHTSRAFTLPANQVSFSALTLAGMPFWGANAICVGAAAAVNFVAGHFWAFRW